jgi:hypothetical protein
MKEDDQGYPEVGPGTRTLGVRPGVDVPAGSLGDMVYPGQGGLSVSPDDPLHLPYFRRPPAWQGTGRDPVWTISGAELGPDLQYRPDPGNARHGFVEPVRPMTLADYQVAIAGTQIRWRQATV